jgi:hypothetical protein
MNSIKNSVGVRKTGDRRQPSQPENPHPYEILVQIHNTL